VRLVDAHYFADENALGLAKLLIRSGRTDIVHLFLRYETR